MEDKLLEKHIEMFESAKEFLVKHWNDADMGSIEQKGSVTAELVDIDKKYKGSELWQKLVINVIDTLEMKMKYEKERKNEKI